MKFTPLVVLLLLTLSCSVFNTQEKEISLVHWNIKELSSDKLNHKNEQIKAVKNILAKLDFDSISINELQYDLPGVPNKKYKTTGKNMEKLMSILKKDTEEYAISFNQANTGNAAKKVSGKYTKNRKNADQLNYGLFPGQYSTAFASEHPIKTELVINDIKWLEFNPAAKLDLYRLGNGAKLPKDMPLFDKNFTHLVIEAHEKEVHVVLLHSVPSYHFGNRQTPNYERNRDQLRFLEWYVTGATNYNIKLPKKYKDLRPIDKNASIIIAGDLNTSIYKNDPGSVVLRRIFNHLKPWMKLPGVTNEKQNFAKDRTPLTLDYIGYKNLQIIDAGIYNPETAVDKGNIFCTQPDELPSSMRKGLDPRVACIDDDAVELKKASDHFPIWAKFKIK